ncbi:hypothetical protein GCE86_20200 [Micromonospora terminaliae]|uniref:Secreted protein n=1 Tax=Micromonospora terminaliae TaxID=1914461 RepID=A0AAJ2ZEU4_9ACTN|nr:hypothetical protein [Micromonospora terminaliae]NES28842.1 hypothetical protein [Micromonospora terminaliae]QGL49131.1 hypothetical protein GCE86_20200 [Micromonospora terminaliae]
MNTMLRKSVLGIAGLAFTGGIFAGPVAAHAAEPVHDSKPAAVATVQGAQSKIDLNDEQLANAKAIIAATKKAGLPERAAVISIATSLQESKLENLGHLGDANDHDSLGLFQQRPSSGWGSPEQITNPEYSTLAFLKGLKQVDGWDKMPLTEAAQTVQVSAYPDAYAQWEQQATDVVNQHWNS